MPPITHEIAPKGDTILVVNNPNAPFAPWPKTSDRSSEESGEPKCNPEVRIRVSSAHLKLASPYFDRALSGDWKEATVLRETGSAEIETSDWGVEALLLLLRIFHCQLSDLPKTITLELLANLCTLIDYYECHSILDFVSERWYQSQYVVTSLGNTNLVHLMSNGTSEITLIQIEELIDQRQMMLFLWVTWVFNKPNAFLACSSFLISTIDGPLTSLGLPLPSTITGKQSHGTYLTFEAQP